MRAMTVMKPATTAMNSIMMAVRQTARMSDPRSMVIWDQSLTVVKVEPVDQGGVSWNKWAFIIRVTRRCSATMGIRTGIVFVEQMAGKLRIADEGTRTILVPK